jgi:SAM-dependent methyltransferase
VDRAAYDQFVELEESHFWFRGRRAIFFDVLDRELTERRDLDVLEIGCGAGGFLDGLQRVGHSTGVELDAELARLCGSRSGAATVCGDAYRLPFPDASHDLVCLFDALEHLADEDGALREIHRVLRPGGLAFFSVPAYQFLYANNDRVAHHCRRYTRRRLASLLGENGFMPRRLTYFNTLLFPLIFPAVLAGKVRERLFGLKDPTKTNLSWRLPRLVNELLAAIMRSERSLLRRVSFPTGHSLIGIFEKTDLALPSDNGLRVCPRQ